MKKILLMLSMALLVGACSKDEDPGGMTTKGLYLNNIDASNIPSGDTWIIADTDATAGNYTKFEGLGAALATLEASRSVDIVFPNLMTLPDLSPRNFQPAAKWTFSAPKVKTVGGSTFSLARNLTKIELPKATDIDVALGDGSVGVTTLIIATKAKATSVARNAFSYDISSTIDLITHEDNVKGLQFRTSADDGYCSTIFKSVNGKVVITLDSNGGSVYPQKTTVNTEGKITELPTPTRKDYDFLGWFTSPTNDEKVTTDRVYTANTTLYAQWKRIVLYEVGDIYKEEGIAQWGVVYKISDGGRHGMVVKLNPRFGLTWSVESRAVPNADDRENGLNNMRAVVSLSSYSIQNYMGFAWIHDLNKEVGSTAAIYTEDAKGVWYMPALLELLYIRDNLSAVNEALIKQDTEPFSDSKVYISSTQDGNMILGYNFATPLLPSVSKAKSDVTLYYTAVLAF